MFTRLDEGKNKRSVISGQTSAKQGDTQLKADSKQSKADRRARKVRSAKPIAKMLRKRKRRAEAKSVRKIVIIDNNFEIRQVIKAAIDDLQDDFESKIEVFSSEDGVQGLGHVFIVNPDIIILDLTLPKYSGRELLDFLQTNTRFDPENKKIILIHQGELNVEVPDGYMVLSKHSPVFLEQLRHIVSMTLSKKSTTTKPNKLFGFSRRTIFWANQSDVLMDQISKLNGVVKWLTFIPWFVAQVLVSFNMLVLRFFTRQVPEANIAQKKKDIYYFRRRYYPTLAGAVLSIMLLFVQFTLFVTGGIFIFKGADRIEESLAGAGDDFTVQRGVTTIPDSSSTATITAGSDYTAPSSNTAAFIRITNAHQTGAGDDTAGSNGDEDDVTAYISNPNNLTTSVTFERFGAAANNTRIAWEIVEYTGSSGGDNEIIVREQSTLAFGSGNTTGDTSAINSVSDDNDVVVFITGKKNPSSGRSNYYLSQFTSEWVGANNIARFTRAASGNTSEVSYAVVEFTGSNWAIQRVENTYSSTSEETQSITTVGSLSRTFIHSQKRGDQAGLDDHGHEVWLSSTSAVSFQLQTNSGNQFGVAWVIENTQTTGTPMNVQRGQGTKSSGGTQPIVQDITITSVDLDVASVFASSVRSTGGGTAYPRGIPSITLTSATNLQYWHSDEGQTQTYRWQVVEWPTAPASGETITVSSTGTQVSSLNGNSTNNHIGGAFSIAVDTNTVNVTSISIAESGTVNADTNLANIKLYYENDTSNPYDCASETYAGTESQYGSTGSFSSSSATFTGSVAITSTSTLCLYPVLDVGSGASNGETIEIEIQSPDSNVSVSAGTIATTSTVSISGTTTISVASSSYTYNRAITVDNTKVGGTANLSNFPVLVSGTYSYLATTGNGGKVENSNGYDIVFADDTSLTTQYDHEIESYNASTGEISMWVKIPTLTYNSDTTFYMHYGDSSISTSQENVTGVWSSSFAMVQHLEEVTTGNTDIQDSTSNNNDSTSVTIDGTGSNIDATGLINGSVQYDGSNDSIYVADAATLDPSTITVSTWVKFDSLPSTTANTATLAYKEHLSSPWYSYHLYCSTSDLCNFELHNSSSTYGYAGQNSSTITTNTWYYLVGTWDGTSLDFYVNGDNSNSYGDSLSGTLKDSDSSLYFSTAGTLDGFLDEIRVASTARSSGWILTEYNNQSSPGTFYTVGTESGGGGGGGFSNGYSYRRSITIADAKVFGSTNFTNFPFPFAGTYSYLATTGNGGKVENANGYDIIFTSDADGTTQLDHEIVSYTASSGTVEFWVEIPTLNATADTTIYLFYGNSSISTSQENVTGTWNANFAAVWHMEESSGSRLDSTSKNNDLTDNNTVTSGTGKLGTAADLERSNNEYFSISHGSYTDLELNGDYTTLFWINFESVGGSSETGIMSTSADQDFNNFFEIYHEFGSGVGYTLNATHESAGTNETDYASFTSATSTWNMYSIVFDSSASEIVFCKDDTCDSADTMSITPGDGTGDFQLGASYRWTQNELDGLLDEVWVLRSEETAEWVQTVYGSQNDPSTFYTLGSEETGGATNSDPVVSSVSLNGGSDISLTENTTTSIDVTATITDADGYADISAVSTVIYRSGVTNAENCTPDNNNCYSTTSYSLSNCSGNSCDVTVSINVQFFAEPTDSGTYSAEYWLAWLEAEDASAATDSGFSPSSVTEMQSLRALDVTTAIDYGTVTAGNNTGASNETTTVTNTGNTSFDLEVSGDDLCTDYPTCSGSSIATTYQEYDLSGFSYGGGTDLTQTAATVQFNLAKPTTTPSNSTSDIYWGIGLPGTLGAVTFSGANSIVAVQDN